MSVCWRAPAPAAPSSSLALGLELHHGHPTPFLQTGWQHDPLGSRLRVAAGRSDQAPPARATYRFSTAHSDRASPPFMLHLPRFKVLKGVWLTTHLSKVNHTPLKVPAALSRAAPWFFALSLASVASTESLVCTCETGCPSVCYILSPGEAFCSPPGSPVFPVPPCQMIVVLSSPQSLTPNHLPKWMSPTIT